MKSIDGVEYAEDGAELAEWLTLQLSTTTQLRQRGVIPQRVRGKGYPIKESVQAYIEYQRARMPSGRPPSEESQEEKSLKDQLLMERLRRDRRENDAAEGILIDVNVVVSMINEIIGILKPRLEALPASIAKYVPEGRVGEIAAREVARVTSAVSGIDVENLLKKTIASDR